MEPVLWLLAAPTQATDSRKPDAKAKGAVRNRLPDRNHTPGARVPDANASLPDDDNHKPDAKAVYAFRKISSPGHNRTPDAKAKADAFAVVG